MNNDLNDKIWYATRKEIGVGSLIYLYNKSGKLIYTGTIFHMTTKSIYLYLNSDIIVYDQKFECVAIKLQDIAQFN